MKAALIHLSDLHFEEANDIGIKRCEKLANTILFAKETVERLFIVVTGDVANKGLAKEFTLAKAFFKDLCTRLHLSELPGNEAILLIPGNHDCDFSEVGDVRPSLLEGVPSELETLDSKGEIARTLLHVQKHFWSFSAEATESRPLLNPNSTSLLTSPWAITALNSAASTLHGYLRDTKMPVC